MRVAHVITRLIVGGAQENTIATVLGLRTKPDVEVTLLSGPTAGPEGTLEPQVTLVPSLLTIIPNLVRPVHPVKDFLAFRELVRFCRQTRPDIVHTHSGKAGVLGRLAAAKAHVPLILHTIHGPSFGPFQGAAANLLFRSAERAAGRSTSHFVCVAAAMRDQYLAAGIARPEQYSVIRSGFDLSPFLHAANDPSLRKTLGLRPEHLVIGKIARLFKLKGHDDLLDVAPALLRENPAIRFLLVGDGSWRQRLEQKAAELGVREAFIFCGLIPPHKVPAYLGIMDVLVHLSLREGLARALPQALAAAKPIVAYDADGAREVCIDAQTGFLVRPGDHDALRRRLAALASAPELRLRFGAQGRERVKREFDQTHMVESLYQLYRELSQRSPAGTPA